MSVSTASTRSSQEKNDQYPPTAIHRSLPPVKPSPRWVSTRPFYVLKNYTSFRLNRVDRIQRSIRQHRPWFNSIDFYNKPSVTIPSSNRWWNSHGDRWAAVPDKCETHSVAATTLKSNRQNQSVWNGWLATTVEKNNARLLSDSVRNELVDRAWIKSMRAPSLDVPCSVWGVDSFSSSSKSNKENETVAHQQSQRSSLYSFRVLSVATLSTLSDGLIQ